MLSVILWWLVIQLFALAALPLAWTLFARLPGRGYPFAKALGLLLVSFLLWLGASFRVLPNAVGGILAALLAVTALSVWLGRAGLSRGAGGERPLFGWLRGHWRLVLATELLFLLVLAGWAAFRAYNPDISGTEKPMELAFINGVLGSTFFPPQDPWLAGYGISYYYFGYVMLGILIRLTGVLPEVGFNLGAALWVALTLIGAFGVVYDLVRLAGSSKLEAGEQGTGNLQHERRGIRYGLLGALFVGVLGNLEGIVELAYHKSLVPLSWIQWLDIKGLTDSAPTGGLTGGFWWWWHASRVIHDKDLLGNSIEVIDEFPFFSYLLGDMHPHVLGLPFVLLAIALALNLLLEAGSLKLASAAAAGAIPAHASRLTFHVSRFWRFLGSLTGLGTSGILLHAVALGALGFLNTWDFPIYVALATLALGVGLAQQNGMSWSVAGRAAAAGVVLAVLGWLLYLPFYLGFQSQLGGVLPNLLFPSRFSQFFVMFGPFLVVTVAFLLLAGRTAPSGRVLRGALVALPWPLLIPVLLLGLIILGMAVLPQGQAYIQELLANPAVQTNIGSSTLRDLAGLVVRLRLATPWTYLALAALIAWAAGVAWARLTLTDKADEGTHHVTVSPCHPVSDLFGLLLISLALLLTLVPEFIYLRDLFGNRMNTVFKFYYQAWVLLALASAYGLSRLAERGTPIALKAPALLLAGLLILGGLWYPAAAIPSKADHFSVDRASGDPRPTLDGLAYLRRSSPADMAAIEWLRANVAPDAVVIEATGGAYTEYARVSMATGNPTLLGWDWHERQWRGNAGYEKLAAGRPEALEQIYRTARTEALPALLDQWGVDYVYVGGLERSKYKISEATLARLDSVLTRAYDRDGVLIYAR